MSTLFNGSKPLQNHPAVSLGMGPGGILFGLPFLGIGVFMTLVASGTVPSLPVY